MRPTYVRTLGVALLAPLATLAFLWAAYVEQLQQYHRATVAFGRASGDEVDRLAGVMRASGDEVERIVGVVRLLAFPALPLAVLGVVLLVRGRASFRCVIGALLAGVALLGVAILWAALT